MKLGGQHFFTRHGQAETCAHVRDRFGIGAAGGLARCTAVDGASAVSPSAWASGFRV